MGTMSLGALLHLERPLVAVGRGLSALLTLLVVWQERAAMRTHLATLDERGLKDIGLTRVDVEAEVTKPFWKI